ncbi:MAG: glycosyltransferase family 2 protein [Candidatus Paceibacterota bacterium]|jgi:hypothetical protein
MSQFPYIRTPYFHVSRSDDLSGKNQVIYRLLEILPGFLAWATLIGTIVLSYFAPVVAAIFIIVFDLWWLCKTIYLSIHLRHNWKRMRFNIACDWQERTKHLKYGHLYQMVILPFYKEGDDVIIHSIKALIATKWNKKKMIVVLAGEARAGEESYERAKKISEKYLSTFGHFIVTKHPANVLGEMPGKGSNITFAAEEVRRLVLDRNHIAYEDVIVSAFDIDTVASPQYFLCLTWYFLNEPDPYKVSFQPVPLYNNNIWDAPMISRVVATSSTFWQMVQQERPEKLATFSSHSVSFKALYEIGYWQKNMVSEDSRIFWNMFLAHDGDYKVVPVAYPVSMDANLAPTFLETMRNVYKQHRRWAWGVENVPYILFGFIKNPRIPLWKKLSMSFTQIEGFWSLATNPIIIFLLGWLPLALGGQQFNSSVLAYNLPIITRTLMMICMLGLVTSAIISISLLPTRPKSKSKLDSVFMIVQWILIPITITVFGAIPGLDAQTRLMFKRYLGFWVTPKHRK